MSHIHIKAAVVLLISFLLSGCAVFVGDEDYHHGGHGYWRGHGYWHGHEYRRGSLDSPSLATTQQALNHEVNHPDR